MTGREGPPGRGVAGAVAELVGELIAAGAATAAEALVGNPDGVEAHAIGGWARRREARQAGPGDLFDLASLTKPFVATLALALDRSGALPLGLPVGRVWPSAAKAVARRTLEELLRHRGGLRAWAPLYALCERRFEAGSLLVSGRWLGARRGTYSDLGYQLWGLSAERWLGRPLAELFAEQVAGPLGLPTATATPDPDRALECRLDTGREARLAAAEGLDLATLRPPRPGQPQDGNTRFLGGLAGHAGLFATAEDLWRLGREWLAPGHLLTPAAVTAALEGSGLRRLGWWRPRRRSAGAALGPRAFGHVGFTGGSLWCDPERRRIAVLLAHRARLDVDLEPWRRRFHRLAAGEGRRAAATSRPSPTR